MKLRKLLTNPAVLLTVGTAITCLVIEPLLIAAIGAVGLAALGHSAAAILIPALVVALALFCGYGLLRKRSKQSSQG